MSLRRVARREWLALGAIVLVAAALRLAALGADLPWVLERSNAPIQDAFWYLEAAAGPIDGSTPEVMPSYDLPVWSPLARTWFRVWGTSLASAHSLGAVLALAALLLFWRVVRAGFGPIPALASAAVLAVHYPSVGWSRTSLIYGPALVPLLVAACLWLGSRGRSCRSRIPLEVAAWLLLVAATAAARPPLGALAGGLLLAHAARSPRLRKPLLALGLVAGLGLALFLVDARLIFEPLAVLDRQGGWVGETARRFLRYLPRQLDLAELGARALEWGSDPGVGAPRAGREWTTARGSGYFTLSPVVLTVAAIGLGLVLLDLRRLAPPARETLALFVGWAGAFVLGGMLLDHRPLRYFVLLSPAVSLLAGYAAARFFSAAREPHDPRWSAAAAAGIGALLLPHLADLLGLLPGREALRAAAQALRLSPQELTLRVDLEAAQQARDRALFLCAGLGLAAGCLALWTTRVLTRRVSNARLGPRFGAVLLVAATLPTGLRSLAMVAQPAWSARDVNALTVDLVDPSGKVIGPSASFLCLGVPRQRLRGGWLYTGDAFIERTLRWLKERGVTHIALDSQQAASANLEARFKARDQTLHLVAALPITRPGATGETIVLLYRLDGVTTRGYQLTPFERRRLRDELDGPIDTEDLETRSALLVARFRTLLARGKQNRAHAIAKPLR